MSNFISKSVQEYKDKCSIKYILGDAYETGMYAMFTKVKDVIKQYYVEEHNEPSKADALIDYLRNEIFE